MEFDHINIKAPREILPKLRDFYCCIFELTEGFRPSFDNFGYWLYSGDNALIHLTECIDNLEKPSKSHLDHIAIRKNNLSSFLETLADQHVDSSIMSINGSNVTQVFIRDPCGVRLEVCFYGETHHQ